MDINTDFSKRVVMHADHIPWVPSPAAGVDRRMLDRIGDEVARATSIVRYAPGSHFAGHVHDGGEEFIVLDGVFQDEQGDYPAGSYIRNPPTSRHTPRSEQGCVIFVKLWQFRPDDRTHIKIDINKGVFVPAYNRPGVAILTLFTDACEQVQCEIWDAGTETRMVLPGGGEVLLLEGSATESGDVLRRHSWLRIPPGGQFNAKAGTQGAKLWIKTGNLRPL
jgi:ChrR Cupin-like domain